MALMKSYTDLEQSKKLAEILPLESADMHYWLAWSDGVSEEKRNTPKVGTPNNKDAIKTYWCPCWSLASLLKILNFPSLTQNKEDEWEVCVFDHDNDDYIKKTASNPVDACVDMVEKLKEFKML